MDDNVTVNWRLLLLYFFKTALVVSSDHLMIVTIWTDVLQRTFWDGTFIFCHKSSLTVGNMQG